MTSLFWLFFFFFLKPYNCWRRFHITQLFHPSLLLCTSSCFQLITHLTENWQLKSCILIFSDMVVGFDICDRVVKMVQKQLTLGTYDLIVWRVSSWEWGLLIVFATLLGAVYISFPLTLVNNTSTEFNILEYSVFKTSIFYLLTLVSTLNTSFHKSYTIFFIQHTYASQLTNDVAIIDPSHSAPEPLINTSIIFNVRVCIPFIDTNYIAYVRRPTTLEILRIYHLLDL